MTQKTHGRVAGNLVRLHAIHNAQPSRRAWYRALPFVAHIFLPAGYLLTRSCTTKRALNYVENVSKDHNCDRLNFIFVNFSMENEDVYCI